MKDEVPKLLKLVDSMPYNFEDEDAEKEAKLYHNRLKGRARQVQYVSVIALLNALHFNYHDLSFFFESI